MERKNTFKSSVIVLGVLCLILALIPFIKDSIINFKTYHYQKQLLENFINNDYYKVVTNENDYYNYIALLEIPKIKLKKGLVDEESKFNDINYNIKIIRSSTMPNVKNGNLILAAHSGNSKISYFKNLDKLIKDDIVKVYYRGNMYTYKTTNIYEVLKTGAVEIIRDKNKTTLTLITCDKRDHNKQIVIISELLSVEPI